MTCAAGWVAGAALSLAAVGACGKSAAPGTADAPPGADARVADARAADAAVPYVPIEAHALGMNDVSLLFQLPEDLRDGTTVARLTGVPDDGGVGGHDLVPRAVFDQLVTTPDDLAVAYEDFHLVALRFDLCNRASPAPCPVGGDGVLRLVFQPMALDGIDPPAAADVALDAVYPIPAADLGPTVDELRALARLASFPTASAIAINQAITSTQPPSEYRHRLRALIARYAVADQLAELTVFGADAAEGRFHWHFRGVTIAAGVASPIAIPTVAATEQDVVDAESPTGYLATPLVDVPAGIATAISQAFGSASVPVQRDALAALAIAQNPTTTGFAGEQCVGCHAAGFLSAARAHDLGVTVASVPGTFTSPRAIATTFSGPSETSLHAFGWNRSGPAISQRVANETAVVLDEIDARFPPAAVYVPQDAGVPDATPTVKRVFVASAFVDGDLATAGSGSDGLAGGDNLCAAAAQRGGLGGTWVAWLSTTAVDAIDRVPGGGPWYLVDGTTLVFPDRAALASGPVVGVDRDETGAQPPSSDSVWTGTRATGRLDPGQTCADWTSASAKLTGTNGLRVNTDASWTQFDIPLGCNLAQLRLYCFER